MRLHMFIFHVLMLSVLACNQDDSNHDNGNNNGTDQGNKKPSNPKYIYFTNPFNGTIQKTDGKVITTLDTPGGAPSGLAIGADNFLYVCNEKLKFISRYKLDGTKVGDDFGSIGLTYTGIAVASDGELYASQNDGTYNQGLVVRYKPESGLADGSSFSDDTEVAAYTPVHTTSYFEGIVFGPDGNLYCAGKRSGTISVYQGPDGEKPGEFIKDLEGVSQATCLTFGPDDKLYVTEYNNSVVKRYNGTTFELFTTDNINKPCGIVFGKDGYIYIANTGGSAYISRCEGLDSATPGKFIEYFANIPEGGPEYMVMLDE
jgi:sugar lactone lactonase YvrE